MTTTRCNPLRTRRLLRALVLASSVLAGPAWAQSLPSGGQVVSGSATISRNGTALTIDQASDKLIANWASFSIDPGHSVTFNQPTVDAVALNRVIGQDPSRILGALNANGKVFLINPNGIIVGKEGWVQAGGFVASTLGIRDEDFLAGNYRFTGSGGSIVNQGSLKGAVVALIAPSVSNQGSIRGDTAMAAGSDVLLDFDGDGLLSVEVRASTMATLVENKGLIAADSGLAVLTAKGASDAMKGVVNNSGTIEARTIGSRNGRIYLLGDMANGAVDVSGTLDASAPQGGDGGFIETSAAKVHIADGARITTAAPLGRTGTFLIDPHDFRIAGTGDNEDITGTALTALLQSTNVTIESSAGAVSGGGDITLADDVNYFANTLTLTAARDINIGAELNVLGTGTLVMNTATANGVEAGVPGGTVNVTIANDLSGFTGRVTFDRTGTGLLTINGEAYTVVGNIADLQNIAADANARYALGADIDASATAGWNAGAGWAPIANFLGVLDGLGHSVDGLALVRPGEFETGLFGQLLGTARNLNVSNADIRAGASVGALAGFLSGNAHHILVSGQVRGSSETGGLAGYIIIQNPIAAPTLSDVHAAVTVTSTSDRVGGLVGYLDSASLRNVSASGSVTGRYRVGGLIGVVEGSSIASIQGAHASGATSGQWYIGGLIGRLTNIGLTDASASGAVSNLPYTDHLTSFVSAFGGLIGQATNTQISDAVASGSITIVGNRDIDSVGGLIGYGNAISVLDSSATGPISVTTQAGLTAWRIGGLVGFADQAAVSDPVSTFTRVHAGGNVQIVSGADSFYIGGLVGQARASLISDAGADGQVGVTSQGDIQYLGGLIGESTGGSVARATALGDVSGISSAGGTATTSAFGGLIGSATRTSLIDVSASGDVSLTGDRNLSVNGDAGGLIGTGLSIQLTRASASGEVTSNASRVGGLMGSLYSDTLAVLVSDVSASGSVFATNANPVFSAHVGGLIGTVDSNGAFGAQPLVAIRNATASGATVSGGSYVGGLAGQFAGDSIQFATASANVIAARQYAGGLVGALGIGTIADASAHGNVTAGSGGSAGGLVGSASVPTYSGLARVYATGNVSSTGNHVGGLVGYNGSLIQDALATGSVQGNLYVGGLAGFNDGQVLRAFASGRVTGADPTRTGGLIGFLDPNGTVGVSFYDRSRSGMFDAGKGTALSLAQAADPFTFIDAGWDFASVWGTPRAGGNPMLRGQTATALYDYYVRITGSLSRSYGDANPALSGVALDGVGGGNLLLGWGSAAGTTADAGTHGWLSPGLLSFGFATGSAADYYIAEGSGGLTIDPRVLSLSGARSYDATTDLAASVFTLGNLANGETLVLTGIGQLADKNAGTARAVSLGTLALADGTGLASNYTLAGGTHVADIGTALITLSGVAAANKVYDGGLTATLDTSAVSMAGLFGGDDVVFGSATGAFLDKNAGTGKTVVITGGALTGVDAANYSFAPQSGATADITPATISAITGIGGGQKQYDTRTDTVLDLSTAAFVGMIAGDQLEVASATGEFADKNAGTNKTVHITGLSLGGADAGNYVLADTTATALGQIDKFGLATLSNLNIATRSYDGTTTATLDLPAVNFDDMLAGDQLTLASASASFADASAGTGKLVNLSGMTLGGADAGNYYLISPTTTTSGTITRATLSLAGFAAANKVYDGGVGATIVSAGTLTGLFGSDIVGFTHGAASFGDRNVGTARTVTLGGIALTGADAANYVIAGTATASADITPKTISAIDGLSVQTRTYDGTTDATLDMSGVDLVGALGGDVVGLVSYNANFADKNAGTGKAVNVTGLSLGGADAGNYVLASTGATLTGEITRAVLTLSGVAVADKIYDGTTNANVTSWGTLAGVLAGESVSVGGGSIAFADKNAGIGKSVSLTGLTLSGADAGNYALATTAATTASIQRATISEITGITAIDKVYDGMTAAALDTSHAAFAGMIAGDTLTVASATGFFTDKNAGMGKTVYAMGLSLGGADAGNYMLASATAVTSADIARATITGVSGIVAAGKTYDGSTAATLDSSGASFTGRIGGDQLTVATATGSFTDKNAGVGKTVGITGISLGGADAGNYVLASTTSVTSADIARATITSVSGIVAAGKTYDGSTTATLDSSGASFAGSIAGDALTVATATGSFADRNAGTGKTVNISGLTLGGADAGNYVLASTSATATADIARATIGAINGIIAADKTYDGTTGAVLDTSGASFAGAIAGDTLTVATATGSFADKNAGTGKTVTITGLSLGGTDAGNYVLATTSVATTADVARAVISGVSGIAATDKVYDGTTGVALDTSGASFAGAIAGDALTIATATGSFSDKNAGTGKTVSITGLSLGGGDAGNYVLASTSATATADIARATISAVTGIAAASKTYDGTTAATLDSASVMFAGMVGGDSLTVATASGAFADKNASAGKTVSITGLSLGGADADNYVLASTSAAATADIARAAITGISGIRAAGKTYDGTVTASIDLSGAILAGAIAGDSLTVSGTGSFADKNAGTGKTVNVTGLVLGGADAGNYDLTSTAATAQADIARASITGVTGIGARDKTYDGTNVAQLDTSGAAFVGMIAGDSLAITGNGAFVDKNAGAGKTVNVAGLSLGGADAGNYVLTATAATAQADITRATISAVTGIAAHDKTYDGTTTAQLDTSGAAFAGMVAGDQLTVVGSAAFADKNAGANKRVVITGLALAGADAANYVLASTTGTASADIARAVIGEVTGIRAGDKIYDGTTAATLDLSQAVLAGVVGGDSVTLASAAGAFADRNAGIAKVVSITGLSLAGADADNYVLTATTARATADIARATIHAVSGITAHDKVYDGTTAATLDLSTVRLDGLIAGDAIVLAPIAGTFADKNAGTGKTVVITDLALSGADANNYVLDVTTATTSATISRATIGSVTGIAAAGKTYDGTASAALELSGAGFSGMIAGDSLTLASATGTFADKNAGTGKTVSITGLSLGGADAGNYVLASDSAIARADIARAVVTAAGITAASKVYDGTTGAALDLSDVRFNGLVAGDTLTIAAATGTFADKNAGENKIVNVSGIHLGGADAGNYVLGGNVTTAATIERRVIGSISGIEAWDKLYDGSNAASLDTTRAMFDGAIAGDLLSVASAVGSFADALPGRQKTVAISGLTLGGADADNYQLASDTTAAFADILWQGDSPLLPDQRDKARIEGFAGASGVLLADPELVEN